MESGPLVPNNPIIREMQPANGDFGDLSALSLPGTSFSGIGPGRIRTRFGEAQVDGSGLPDHYFLPGRHRQPQNDPVYEASGSIAINKPDSGLVNFSNSPTFSVDYYDPTEMETEVKILQSDLLALQVIKELGLDRRPEFGGRTAPLTSSLDLAPDPLRPMPDAQLPALVLSRQFESSARSQHSYHRSSLQKSRQRPGRQRGQYPHDHLHGKQLQVPLRLHHAGLRLLSKQLVDLQMKVETSQEKLVHYQKEHEILGIDEKQNITTSKLDELNRR